MRMHARRSPESLCSVGRAAGHHPLGAGAGERDRRAHQRRQDRRRTRLPRHLRESLLLRRESGARRPAAPHPRCRAAAVAGGGTAPGPARRRTGARPRRRIARPGTRRRTRSSTIFYWLGTRQHSSWALRTSEGLVIIDTNFAWATEPEIINGLTTLGLDPRQIKYVVISHAHGDHDQGAAELQKRFGAKVVMGAPDWDVDAAAAGHRRRRRARRATWSSVPRA